VHAVAACIIHMLRIVLETTFAACAAEEGLALSEWISDTQWQDHLRSDQQRDCSHGTLQGQLNMLPSWCSMGWLTTGNGMSAWALLLRPQEARGWQMWRQ
jgi:hypothetical protein